MSESNPIELYKSSVSHELAFEDKVPNQLPDANPGPDIAKPNPGTGGNGPDNGRHGVVAIVFENDKLLIIRRSPLVRAPNLLCLPGGGIEPGESLNEAMRREMLEELNLAVQVNEHLWTSVTRWGTRLEWMICSRVDETEPQPNPWEVSEYLWLTLEELRVRDDLLGSLPDFLAAIDRKEIDWPRR